MSGLHVLRNLMKRLILLLLTFSCTCFAADIKPSILDGEKEERRDKAYEPWIPFAEHQARFDDFNSNGMFPVYSERKEGKIRTIYIDMPDGLTFCSWASMSRAELLKKHKQYTQEGFVLLSLSTHPDYDGSEGYWATWVNESRERKLISQLRRLGISQATIQFD